MEKSQYDELKRVQKIHWWFSGKMNIVIKMYEKFCMKSASDKIFDVGCGMGLTLEALKEHGEVFGMDMEQDAVDYCRTLFSDKCYAESHIMMGYLPDMVPFQEKFDTIVGLDVIEHIKDDQAALKSFYNMLKDDGKILLTVPALMSMWSGNDELNHHFRRYEKQELVEKVSNAGFKIDFISFYNSKLFIPAYIVRVMKNIFKIKSSDVPEQVKDNFTNKLFRRIFVSELKRLLKKKTFKIGVSLIIIASK